MTTEQATDTQTGAPGQEGQAEVTAESLADALGTAWDEYDAGDQDGEAPPEKDAQEPQEAAQDDDQDEETAEGADEDAEASDEAPEPPEHWSDDDKAVFADLPDEAKSWWVDKVKSLEDGYREKFEANAEATKLKETVDGLFDPFRDKMQAAGLSDADVIRDLVAIGTAFETKPLEAIQWVAGNYGRSVAGTDQARELVRSIAQNLKVEIAAGEGTGGTGAETAKRGEPSAADKRIAALEQEIAQLKGQSEQQQRLAQQQQQQTVEQTIAEFRDEKDAQGKPAHPHFDKVRDVMGALMAAGKSKSMKDAYEKAIWMEDDVRKELLKQQAAEKANGSGEKRRAKVDKARKASTPKSSPNGAAASSGPSQSVMDDLAAEWDRQAAGRV